MEKLSGRSVSAAHPRCRMTLIARKRPSRSYRMRFQKNNRGASIMMHSHQTAPTQFVEANSIRFAYRRFGKTGAVPLVFSQHYIGTIDYWDPTVTDGLARDREVILFNNAGVSGSSGEVPTTFEQMGADAIAFIKALGLKQVDLFGFSIGSACHALQPDCKLGVRGLDAQLPGRNNPEHNQDSPGGLCGL